MIIVPITIKEANEFVLNFHRHNRPTLGGKWAIGLEHDGILVGVAICGRAVARNLDDRFTAEVTRTCTNEEAPKGAVSKLYAACWRAWKAMGGRRMITYTLKSESGASLRGAGWKIIAELPPSKGWNRSSRIREWQPIYGQMKLRWEVSK